MARHMNKKPSNDLYRAIMALRDEEECRLFFEDLCTINELRAMEQRYDVGVLLDSGMVYTEILGRTGASSATISRVNRVFSTGNGTFQKLIDRRKEEMP